MRKVVATPHGLLPGIGLMLLALLVFSASALASQERPAIGSFGPVGTGPGTFANVQGVTVDQSTGDVFVYDDGEGGRIYKFDAAGEPVDFSGLGSNAITGVGGAGVREEEIAVDSSSGPAAGDIYAANNSEVRIYSAAGAPLGSLSGGEMCGVAVDSSGAVYVGIYSGEGVVRKYVATSNPVTDGSEVASMGSVGGVCNVAADSEGNVYAAKWNGGVTRYEAIQFGSFVASGTLIDGSGYTLTVDQATSQMYVNEEHAVAEYEPGGSLAGKSGSEQISGSFGIGVDSAKDELYVPSQGRVIAFGAPVLLPTVSGGEASEVMTSSATLAGDVNPENTTTTYQFQYGTTTSYGSVAPASPQSVGSDSTTHEVNAQLTGLTAGTLYHYRLLATNSNGTSYGSDGTFKTAGPATVRNEHVSARTQNTATVEAEIEPNRLDARYQIEYGTSASYGTTTATVDIGTGARKVVEELKGLQIGTQYHYRFVATNVAGTTFGSDNTFSTAPVADIESESIAGVANTEATLEARVNVFGTQSTYHFEYGPTISYGSVTPEEALSSGAQVKLDGLLAETAYHFRVVIENQYGTVDGKDATFTTAPTPSLNLPDSRGYEKVSPNNNADGNVYAPAPINLTTFEADFNEQPYVAAEDGDALVYMAYPSETGGNGHEGGGNGNQYLARRLPGGGWGATNVSPPSDEFEDVSVYQGFSPNLSTGILVSSKEKPLAAGAPEGGFRVPYLRDFESETYRSLLTVTPRNRTIYSFSAYGIPTNSVIRGAEPAYVGSSANLEHVLWMANDALTPNAVDGGEEQNNLYDTHQGLLTLVNVLPDGSSEPNAIFGGPVPSPYGAEESLPPFSHAISEDGSRIFWTDLNNGNLYLRENGATTVQVDAGVGGGGQFWTASADGSKVLFTKAGDLYEYDVNSAQTIDLTPGGEVQGVVGATSDLSYIYFVADGVLAPGAAQQTCSGEIGHCNLYALHAGDSPKFIGMLSRKDNDTVPTSFYRHAGDWLAGMGNKEAEVTPDGRHLVFVSVESLTGYTNDGAAEVYVYDYESGELHCASCNPTGEPPTGRVGGTVSSAWLPISHMNDYTPRWMSADGNRVFFDSLAALVPEDTNGQNDVYEWERDGSGTCTTRTGCIYLLSGGTSPEGSYFLDAGANGNDAFLATRAKLASEDQNNNIDAYDVRVGAPRPPVVSQCTGTGCQGIPSSPPVFATPSSVTYNGVGNFAAPGKSTPKTKKAKAKKRKKIKKHKRKSHKASVRAHRLGNGNRRSK